jgi:SAM-dependent methyltransferase
MSPQFEATDEERTRARVISLVHSGNPGDVGFYVMACSGARSVLELGCGTGRIQHALAAAGHKVTGIDFDRPSLAENEATIPPGLRRRIELALGDMRDFDLGRTFDRVLIPYNTLYALPTDSDVVSALRSAARHLTPRGQLLFDGYVIEDHWSPDTVPADETLAYRITVIDGALRVDIFDQEVPIRDRPDSLTIHYRYETWPLGAEAPIELHQSIPHHFIRPHRLPLLLEAAGLVEQDRWGDFDGSAWDEASAHMIIAAGLADSWDRVRGGGFGEQSSEADSLG